MEGDGAALRAGGAGRARRLPAAAAGRGDGARRASTCRATRRCRDGCGPRRSRSRRASPTRSRAGSRSCSWCCRRAGQAGRDPRRGPGGRARRGRGAAPERGCSDDRPGPGRARRRRGRRGLAAGARAGSRRSASRPRCWSARATRAAPASARTAPGRCTQPTAGLAGFAPDAWAGASGSSPQRLSAPSASSRPGSERGNEVMAHVAALADLPLAANCVAAAAGDPLTRHARPLGRQPARGGARVHCAGALLTVAPHAVAAQRRAAAPRASRASRPRCPLPTLVVQVRRAVDGRHRRRLAGRGQGRRQRRPRRRVGRGLRRDRGARRPARRRGRLLARGDQRRLAAAHRPGRARPARRSRPRSTSPAASAARPSTWPAARARSASSRSTPTPRRRSSPTPTTR